MKLVLHIVEQQTNAIKAALLTSCFVLVYRSIPGVYHLWVVLLRLCSSRRPPAFVR